MMCALKGRVQERGQRRGTVEAPDRKGDQSQKETGEERTEEESKRKKGASEEGVAVG